MRKRRLKQIIWYIAKLMDHCMVKIVIIKLWARKLCKKYLDRTCMWTLRMRFYFDTIYILTESASERFFPDTLQLALYVAFIYWRSVQFITLLYWYLNIAFVFQIRTHW